MELVSFEALGARVRGMLQDEAESLAYHRPRPALLICPGGAYGWLSHREMDPPALEFLAMGYQVFLLEYSCAPEAGEYRPLRQLAEAVRQLRRRSGEWGLDPGRIAVMGFSAGGHLAASLGALWDDPELALPAACRPDALILCYPVISAYEFAHEDSIRNVTGGDEALRRKLHLPDRVTPAFPPCFLWHGGEDSSVPPENSLLLAVQLKKNAVPFELHLFETGGHGLSVCTQEVGTPDAVCRAWLPLCKTWLNHRFQYTP